MSFIQKSVLNHVRCSGVGLHTGAMVTVDLFPAAASNGIVVQIGSGPRTRIDDLIVQKTARCTRLIDSNGNVLDTAEHLLAALATRQISNCFLVFSGPEVPILDGCAQEWLSLIDKAGVVSQGCAAASLIITKPFTYSEGMSEYSARPGYDMLDITVEYPHPVIGRQKVVVTRAEFESLASARTFVMEADIARLKAAGLAHGGSLDNALVIGDAGPLNTEGFRFADECGRHKALDVVGDLYVCGLPIRGTITVSKPGHAANCGFLKALLASDCIAYASGQLMMEAA
jgi:UDP-3-O-[3-hydroxymyristoyl] N-acetylglucosamine deacetylase